MANAIPKGSAALPLHPDVEAVFVCDQNIVRNGREVREISIRYYGTAEQLIAAGVATAEMLLPGRRPRSNPRVDADGDPCSIDSYFRMKDGQPYRHYRFMRTKRIELIDRLPGGREAMTAYEEREDWLDGAHKRGVEWQAARQAAQVAQPVVQRPSYLRLVVDNTRVPP